MRQLGHAFFLTDVVQQWAVAQNSVVIYLFIYLKVRGLSGGGGFRLPFVSITPVM